MVKNIHWSLLLVLITLAACSNKQFPQSGASIQTEQLRSLTARPNVTLIDVRTEGEYKEGHIPGAIQLDVLQETQFLQQIQALDPKKPYVLYCRSGRRSNQAMDLMQKQGFKKVVHLEGGFEGWKGPTEK